MRLLVTLLIALAAGCGSPALKGASVTQARLADAQTRASQLAGSGDYAGAARQYREALRLATALEDADALAANAVNLSVVEQWLGHETAARAALAAVLDDPHTPFPERRRVQAELRRAIVDLAAGDVGAAAVWAGQADERCTKLGCEYAATILNVRAQVALASGRPAEAAELAVAADARSRSIGSRAETANALRILGRARQMQGDATAALEPLRQALELDRELGDPRKILADLGALARASESAGDVAAANDYRARSVAVSRAMSDPRRAGDLETLMRR